MAEYQLTQTGPTVQQAINKALEIQGLLDQETAARQAADALLATKTELQAETARAEAAEALLATITSLQNEIDRATGVEGTLQGLINAIAAKIPAAASASNQLADKDFVNSSIATSTATFRGTSAPGLNQSQFLAWANGLTHDLNDYVYWNTVDSVGNTLYKRYKFDGTNWVFEYDLNNSSFTASEWAAIQSGITAALVAKLTALPNNADLQAALNAKYVKPNTGIPSSDLEGNIPKSKLATSVQTSLGKADTALQEHQDISMKANIADLKSGELIVKLAENLESWESRDNLTVEDTWDDIVQTTAGEVSVVTSEGARVVGIKAKTHFSATSLVATGFNLLHRATAVGTGYYFLVPKLEFGTFGTALKPNGVLFTDKNGGKMTPTVRFKAIADGVPTSINDGSACTYTDSNGYRFYTTPGVGYMIVSGITFAETCPHIAWSRRYDEFISPTASSDAGSAIVLSTILNAIHSWGQMLVIGDSYDEVEWTSPTTAKWTRRTDRVAPTWTTVQNEGDTYTHTATIGTMKLGGTAILDENLLSVNGYEVSYTDTNESASSGYVYFELATPVTGTVTLNNGLTIEDWGLVYLAGAVGTAFVTMLYAQGYPDALATLVDARLDAEVNKLNKEIGANDARIRVLEAIDLSMYDYTGVRLMLRNTANCYVVRTAGSYKIPLVYGNAIKNGDTNAAAYTRLGTTYTADFVNHLGNQITSPFIEANAGCSAGSVGLLWQTDKGDITEVNLVDGTDCRYLQFTVGQIPATNGVAVVYVKDKNGDTMWSWMIWLTTDNLEPLTFTNHTEVEYNLMPEALGTIWNAGRTKSFNVHYQWGRKDPMCPPNAYNSNANRPLYDIKGDTYTGFGNYGVANDSDAGGTVRSVANSIKMPEKFFLQYDEVGYNWNNLDYFYNFWNAADTAATLDDNQATAIKTIYDPCPAGWMLPAGRAFTGFTTSGSSVSSGAPTGCEVVGSFSNGWKFKRNADDAAGNYFPASGYRGRTSGALDIVGSIGYYWSFASNSRANARYLNFHASAVTPTYTSYRANGFSVRPSRELS